MNKPSALPLLLFWLLPLLAVSAEPERNVHDPFMYRAFTEKNIVYDLSRAEIPVMVALTFNHGYDSHVRAPMDVDDEGRPAYHKGRADCRG